jgi:hypothetical protein
MTDTDRRARLVRLAAVHFGCWVESDASVDEDTQESVVRAYRRGNRDDVLAEGRAAVGNWAAAYVRCEEDVFKHPAARLDKHFNPERVRTVAR